MRVALVAHTSSHWTPQYVSYLAGRGHEVRVISFSREPLANVDVDYVGRGTPRRLKIPHYLSHVPRVRRLLRRFSPDVVLATYLSSNGVVAALARPRALVVSAHGGDVLRQAGYLPGGSLHGRMMRFVCDRAAIVHAVSDEIADGLIAAGVPAERIRCFPVGVDVDWFSPAPRAPSERDDTVGIVCTRRQEPVYANDTLVEALAILQREALRFSATLVGGGPLLDERRAQVKALDLEACVRFTGQVPQPEVRRVLQEADIYVSASSSDGASLSLLEAMACGLFPVVSAIPANQAWVEHGTTGLLFEPGDDRQLADGLRRALGDSALRASAGAANRARVVREGSIAANMERMEGLLLDAAG